MYEDEEVINVYNSTILNLFENQKNNLKVNEKRMVGYQII